MVASVLLLIAGLLISSHFFLKVINSPDGLSESTKSKLTKKELKSLNESKKSS